MKKSGDISFLLFGIVSLVIYSVPAFADNHTLAPAPANLEALQFSDIQNLFESARDAVSTSDFEPYTQYWQNLSGEPKDANVKELKVAMEGGGNNSSYLLENLCKDVMDDGTTGASMSYRLTAKELNELRQRFGSDPVAGSADRVIIGAFGHTPRRPDDEQLARIAPFFNITNRGANQLDFHVENNNSGIYSDWGSPVSYSVRKTGGHLVYRADFPAHRAYGICFRLPDPQYCYAKGMIRGHGEGSSLVLNTLAVADTVEGAMDLIFDQPLGAGFNLVAFEDAACPAKPDQYGSYPQSKIDCDNRVASEARALVTCTNNLQSLPLAYYSRGRFVPYHHKTE